MMMMLATLIVTILVTSTDLSIRNPQATVVIFVLLELTYVGSEKEEKEIDPIDQENQDVIDRPIKTNAATPKRSNKNSRKRNKRRKRTIWTADTDDEDSFDPDLAPIADEHEEQEDAAAVLKDAGPSPLHVDFVMLPKPEGDRNSKAAAPTTHEMATRAVLDKLVFRNG